MLFAVLTVVGYGLLTGTAGFHWDDWGFAWAARFLGPAQFIPSFGGFRPFLGPIFFVTTSLIPPIPLYWQLFALLIRLCIGLSAWWALKSTWSGRSGFALLVSLLVLVYPGYSQHWVALTHINQELIPLISYLLSFGVGAWAVRKRSILLTLFALLLQFWGLFPTEYFLGFEGLRFFLLWSMLEGHRFRSRFQRALIFSLPYWLLWLANAGWLAHLYRTEAYISYGVNTEMVIDPLNWISGLGDAAVKAGLVAWGQIVILAGSALPSPTSLLTLGIVVLSFGILLLTLPRLSKQPVEHSFAAFAILAGLAGIFLGRIPSLVAGLPLTLQSVFDRFTVSMALGASLFAAGLLEYFLGGQPRMKWPAISLLIALAVGQQFFNANIFRRDWARQQEIYWQMTWRMPALKSGTLLLTTVIPDMPLETDLSFTAPVNWIYAPRYTGGDLPYALLYTEARLGGGAIPELKPGLQISLPFRTVSFHGSTSATLVFLVPRQGCLRVLDPALGDQVTYSKESDSLISAIALSDPSRILLSAPSLQPPQPPFGSEPAHSWCYFYEKAEKDRQAADWEHIIDLQKEASSEGYVPEDPLEWLPFVEANARLGNMDNAILLSQRSMKASARTRKGLCMLWDRIGSIPGREGVSSQIQQELGCRP